MLSIRKVKTKSGATAIQVVVYEGKKSKIIKHIGSGNDNSEISLLKEKAEEFIGEYSGQLSLSNQPTQNILFVDRAKCIGVTHQFARRFLLCCAKECGLSDIDKGSTVNSVKMINLGYGNKRIIYSFITTPGRMGSL